MRRPSGTPVAGSCSRYPGPQPHTPEKKINHFVSLTKRRRIKKDFVISSCSMTFYFSFEVPLKVKQYKLNSKEKELQIENNQGGGTKIRTITSRFGLFWKLVYVF